MRLANNLFCFLIAASLGLSCQAQGVWTWMAGPDTTDQDPVFGIQGIASPTNRPPAQYSQLCWTDLNGKFWLFGGVGTYADLWMFDPLTLEWTWVKGNGSPFVSPVYGTKGVPSAANTPGQREFTGCTWVSPSGDLWLYGGSHDNDIYSDLWKYSINDNMWTWMSGTDTPNALPVYGTLGVGGVSNHPGNRAEIGSSWVDQAGNFWLYGGQVGGGFNQNRSDMWMYSPQTNEWTWKSGSQSINQTVVHGTQGLYSTANTPGGRRIACMYVAPTGELFSFGGAGLQYGGSDLFKYNPQINQWAWVNGSAFSNASGLGGVNCEPNSNYYPSARYENRASWKDTFGNLWIYGGANGNDVLSDMWVYLIQCHQWARVQNGPTDNVAPTYGILGVPAITNSPGGRMGNAHWTDLNGNFWMFGTGYPSRSDMWVYTPDFSCIGSACQIGNFTPVSQFTTSSNNVCCYNACINFINTSVNTTTYEWFFPGAIPSYCNQTNPTNICYQNPGLYDVTLIGHNSTGADTLVMQNYINVTCPTASLTLTNDTLFATVASSYQWFLNSDLIIGATNNFYVPDTTGSYSVVATNAQGCTAGGTLDVYLIPQANVQPAVTKICPDSCISLGNQSTNSSSYEWFFPGASPSYSTAENPINICYSTSGNYDVTLIAHNGPYSDTTVSQNLIQVYAPPSPTIVQSNDTLYATNVQAGSTYQWSFNNSIINGATGAFYFPLQNGSYTVNVVNPQGCSGANALVVTSVGLNEIETGTFALYPNPADGLVNIVLPTDQRSTVNVVNALGQIFWSKQARQSFSFDASLLPSGVYRVSAVTDKSSTTKALVVTRR